MHHTHGVAGSSPVVSTMKKYRRIVRNGGSVVFFVGISRG